MAPLDSRSALSTATLAAGLVSADGAEGRGLAGGQPAAASAAVGPERRRLVRIAFRCACVGSASSCPPGGRRGASGGRRGAPGGRRGASGRCSAPRTAGAPRAAGTATLVAAAAPDEPGGGRRARHHQNLKQLVDLHARHCTCPPAAAHALALQAPGTPRALQRRVYPEPAPAPSRGPCSPVHSSPIRAYAPPHHRDVPLGRRPPLVRLRAHVHLRHHLSAARIHDLELSPPVHTRVPRSAVTSPVSYRTHARPRGG
jgi:hypothetical protein